MSTPNDKQPHVSSQRPRETDEGYARRVAETLHVENLVTSEQARIKREQAILDREAAQPSPKAVELALEQEKANQEKIKATVQAARASATQPCHPFPPQGSFTNKEVHDTLKQKDDDIRKLQKQANDNLMLKMDMERRLNIAERERDALQAQRDELLGEAKCMLRELNNRGITCSKWDAAIARATKGGAGQ